MKNLFYFLTLISTVFLSQSINAATMVVSPTTGSYEYGSNASITLSWVITSGGGSASSSGGQFSVDTTTINVGATSIPATPISGGTTSAINTTVMSPSSSVLETFFIPAAVISYAQTNNLSTVYYSRSFNVGTEGYTQLRFFAISLSYRAPTVNASPGSITYLLGSNGISSIAWQITTYGNGSGNAYLDDGSFAFAPNGNSLIPVGGTLILPPIPLQASGTSTGIENLLIPQAVIDYAQQNNLTTIYYGRPYYFDNLPQSGEVFVRINLLNANPNAALNINRLALRFSDNTSVKIIQPNTTVMALADISYTGSGLFDAMWEIAEPVSTIGQPVFVPIQPVRQFLVAGGRVFLQSPVLPTSKQGLHILRLTINQPTLSFAIPVLQYSVNPQGDVSGVTTLPPLRINAPVENALLATDTRFEWQPVKGAHGYQLELFLPEQSGLKPDDAAIAKRTPASGMMVPAKRNALTLGELSRSKLRPNTTYYWRIIAIGNKGQILSTSALREIRIP